MSELSPRGAQASKKGGSITKISQSLESSNLDADTDIVPFKKEWYKPLKKGETVQPLTMEQAIARSKVAK